MKTLILAHEAIIKITLVLTISNCSIFQFLEYYEDRYWSTSSDLIIESALAARGKGEI